MLFIINYQFISNTTVNIFQTKITELSASINSDANQTERINKLFVNQ